MERVLKGIREVNLRKKGFESTLLVENGQDGLKGREWYKSLVVAPGRWLGESFNSIFAHLVFQERN